MGVDDDEEPYPSRSTLGYLQQKGSKGKSSLTRSSKIKLNLYKDLDRLEQSLDADFEKHLADARAASLNHDSLTNGKDQYYNVNEEEERSRNMKHGFDDDGLYREDDEYNGSEGTGSILRGLEQVPFVGDILPPFGSRPSSAQGGLSDASIHPDKDILGDILTRSQHGMSGGNSSSRYGNGGGSSDGSNGKKPAWIPNQDLVDEKYSVTPLINPAITSNRRRQREQRLGTSSSPPPRTMSPGQYFAARSLPLDSFDEIWDNTNLEIDHKTSTKNDSNNKKKVRSTVALSIKSSRKNSKTYDNDDLLLQSFKLLPHSLSHNYKVHPVNNDPYPSSQQKCTSTITTTAAARKQLHQRQSPDESIIRQSTKSKNVSSSNNPNGNNEYVSIPVIRQDHKSDHTTNTGVVSGTVRLRRIRAVDRSDTDIEEESNQYSLSQRQDTSVAASGGCTFEPDRLVLQCKLLVDNVQLGSSQLRISSNSTHRVKTYSLFSARGKLKFFQRQGVLPAGGHVDVIVRLRRSAVASRRRFKDVLDYNFETILILIDGKHAQQVDVDMEIIDERRIIQEQDNQKHSVSPSFDIPHYSPSLPHAPASIHNDGDDDGDDGSHLEEPITPLTKCPLCVIEKQCC
ncbi:hypothetical protein BDB00DRAFT_875323 [Zychaea mexicana]|uniref:uncharacterized protein n=1 Tax=Zychaea mexicana TaxID=64656 RepID=UPI0022FE8B90|nr:uncharacterized protein BDB00DRAFT_875323 [Zychaea mexicana]KAI9490423.1 hypothetical protein BDB00DRAFT_875323 [Zychaea mexicana]